MKKYLLSSICSLFIFCIQSYTQCAGGPDALCVGTSGPCGSLHDGTVGQAYSDTISFWAPNQVDAGSPFGMVDFVQFQIVTITGLPAGLNWSCGNGTCIYDPQPAGILTNFNVCGTPIVPGSYTLHVHIIGTVYIPGLGNQSGDQYYDIPLNVVVASGGNPVFSFTPNQACDSASVTYTPLINFPMPQINGYYWDFGGGNVSSVTNTNPITINYNTPGTYITTCTTSVYNLILSDLTINVGGQGWWCGDVEELICGSTSPDIVPTFTTGVSNWVGPEATDQTTPTWSAINFVLTSTSYSIGMVDIDVISGNDFPAGPITGLVTGTGVYNFNNPGNFSGSFTISAVLATEFIATDTVIIYAAPPMDTIQATATSFCPYDSVTLSVDSGYYYEWFLNDTLQVQIGNDNTYTTSDAGNYSVHIIDPVSGCFAVANPIMLTAFAAVPPGFMNVGITETPPGTYHSILPAGYTYQWLYFDGINYFTLPSETTGNITPTVNGIYCLVATNSSGCLDTSNCLGFHIGMENINIPFMAKTYPNPSDGQINLTISNLTEDASLSIYDMIGQQVYSIKIMGTGQVQEMYDLTFLTKGIYILELRNKQNRFTQKLVIE